MNEIAMNGDKRMTVKEVAQALGVSDRTVRDNVSKLFPGIARDGIATYLNEEQVTLIKLTIERSGRNDLANVRQLPKTKLEKQLIIKQAMDLQDEIINELKVELAISESRVARLIHDDRTFTTGELAKEIGMKSAQELNQALLAKGISYKDARGVWLLHSQYAGKGLQRIKDKEVNGKVVYYAEWTGIGRDWLLGIFSAE
jgi:phage antirepressor YoqD-like protein